MTAIKAMIRYQAAMAHNDEMHRRASARRRSHLSPGKVCREAQSRRRITAIVTAVMGMRAWKLGGAVSALLLVWVGTAAADTFNVTRLDDPPPGKCRPADCSLREAILAANSNPGEDTVVLQGGQTYD